jgi:hypothetical protein
MSAFMSADKVEGEMTTLWVLVLVTQVGATGIGSVAVDMPSQATCQREAEKAYKQRTVAAAFCLDRR